MFSRLISAPSRGRGRPHRPSSRLVGAGAAAALALIVAAGLAWTRAPSARSDAPPASSGAPPPSVADNGWIAYATAPADGQRARSGGTPDMPYLTGSDIYLDRAGSERRLVAGRGDGTIWNVCPAFSPDGRFLAFGTRSPKGRAVRIVGVEWDGTIFRAPVYTDFADRRHDMATPLVLEGRGDAPCPRWSADGSRLAYLNGGRVVVRGLNGSFPPRRAGDPARADFRRRSNYEVVSPEGDRVARLDGGVVVSRLDGSEPRDLGVESLGTYALAAWSPDGHTLLVMRDVSGFHFTMLAVPVDAPSEAVPVGVAVRVNHPRSWPGHGDVSWRWGTSP
jgi:Tol biopolymer transport system component